MTDIPAHITEYLHTGADERGRYVATENAVSIIEEAVSAGLLAWRDAFVSRGVSGSTNLGGLLAKSIPVEKWYGFCELTDTGRAAISSARGEG